MPKRAYSPDEKKLVRRLLLIHAGNVPIVHHLTGFPKRTIHNWRNQWDDDYELYTDALAQNLVSRANALAAAQHAPNPAADSLAASAQSENLVAQYAQIRANLMNHATKLSHDLALGDGEINQRVHALSRLLDRLLALDELLDYVQPGEQTIRFEHYYDGQVYQTPPWDQFDVTNKEGAMAYAELRLREELRSWNQLEPKRPRIHPAAQDDQELNKSLADMRERIGYQVQPYKEIGRKDS